jgi:hypothetical protein
MKKLFQLSVAGKKQFINYMIGIALMTAIAIPNNLSGQTDSTAAAPAAEEKTTYSPLVEFLSTQKADNSVDLKASVKAKISGTLTKLSGLKIEFYLGSDSASTKLGETYTDKNGVALLNCKPDQLKADAEGKLNFKVTFAGKDSIDPAEEVLNVKRARLEITPVKEDSLLTVKMKLVDLSTGAETAVPEIDLGVFVKRLFSGLKLGEGKTDENGEVSVEIPNALPGDAKGNITLIAKLDDNEIYGNLEASVVQQWGTPVSDEIKELPRALWSPHPPMWMLITFIILMTAVWGHYIVIIFELFRLRKEEPKQLQTTK